MPFLAPVIAAVSAFAATTFGGFIVKAVVGIGLSLASSLFAKKPEKAVGGTKLDVQYGADQPREIAVGLVAIAGHDVYSNTYGSSNKYLQKVFALSDFPITALLRVAVNGEWRTIDWNDTEGRGSLVTGFPDNNDPLRIRLYDGRQTELQAVELGEHGLIGSSSPAGRWTGAHVGRSTAFVVINCRFKDEEMASVPTLLFEFQGAPLYDIRKDSSAGGAGSHRWDDQSTWEYSENPIVQTYAYERGFFVGGQLLVGKGMPSRDLPAAPWMSAMNVCDEATPTRAKRYRAGALFNTGDGVTHRDNLEPVLDAASAVLAELVDGDRPIVGANQPVVATITDDDLIVGASWEYQAKRSRSDLINAVYGTYNNPVDLWAATSYEPRVSESALAVDRERHAAPVNFTTVDNESQAMDLAEAQLRRNRYQASETITVRPRWVTLELGDWIVRASAKHGTKTFQVVGRTLAALGENGARNVTLVLAEVGPGIYDTSIAIPERQIRVVPAPPFFVSTVQGFDAFASAVTGPTGRVMPAIGVQWDLIDDLTVNAVVIRYWKTSDPANKISKVIQVPAVSAILVEGVLPVTSYSVEATVVTDPVRATIWTGPEEVLTLSENLAVTNEQLAQDVRDLLDQIDEDIEVNAAAISEQAQALAADAQALAQEIIDRTEAVAAEAQARAQAIAAEALARTNALSAEALARGQAITAEAQARADELAAEAEARNDAVQAEAEARGIDVIAVASNFRALSDALLAVAMETAEQGARGLETFQNLREELRVTSERAFAGWTEAITVAIGPNSAVAERFSKLEVGLTDETSARKAAITSLQTTLIAADAAEASTREVLAAQLRGSYAGTDPTQLSEGILANLQNVFASQYASLATTVTLLTAGTDRQFDYIRLWEFDTVVEGWGGNGAPTHLTGGGFLRPANHADDPYVTSPTGLGIATDTYAQVLIRIRKTGAPVWAGQLWWRAAADVGWDAARRAVFAEPSFDSNGFSVVAVSPGYSLILDQIRLDLSAAQTATDFYSIDWVALGRPSLGASRAALTELSTATTTAIGAEASGRLLLTTALLGPLDPATGTLAELTSGLLFQERQARSTADMAISTQVTGLQSQLTDVATGLSGQATLTQTLTTRVTTAEGLVAGFDTRITSTASSLTALEAELGGKADASAVDELFAEVAELGGGGLVSQAESIRSIRSSLGELDMLGAEEGAAALLADQKTREAVADAYQSLSTYAATIDGRTELTAKAVLAIELTLPGKADVSAVQILSGRIDATDGRVSAISSAILSVEAEIDGKADSSALDALSVEVEERQGEASSTQAAATRSLRSTLIDTELGLLNLDAAGIDAAQKAREIVAEAYQTLNTAISVVDGLTKATAEAILAVQVLLPGKAEASVVQTLSAKVVAQGDAITSTAGLVNSIVNELPGKASASGLIDLQTVVSAQGSAIASQSSAVIAIQNTIPNLATSNALFALDSRVGSTEAGLVSASESVLSIGAQLQGKASTSVTDTMSTRITETQQGLTSVAGRTQLIENTVPNLATVTALNATNTFISNLNGVVIAQGESVTSLRTTVDGKASTAITDAMSTRITQTEQGLTSTAGRILLIENTVPNLATVTALNATNTSISNVAGVVIAQAEQINTISAELPGKASTTVTDAMSTRITQTGQDIVSVAGRTQLIENTLPGLASVQALNAVSTNVSNINGVVTAQGEQLNTLTAEVDGATASGLFSITVSAAPAGALSQVNLAARASAGGAIGSAAISLIAYSDAGNIRTRAVMLASEIVFADAGNTTMLGVVQGAALGAQDPAARIVTITGDKVRAGAIISNNGRTVFDLDGGTLTFSDAA